MRRWEGEREKCSDRDRFVKSLKASSWSKMVTVGQRIYFETEFKMDRMEVKRQKTKTALSSLAIFQHGQTCLGATKDIHV